MKKKFFFAALAALVLIGCEQKQSELDINQARTQSPATITGKVTYNPGGENSKSVAVDSVEVIALVKNTVYSAGATGEARFMARTDAEGNYSINIPCGQKGIAATDVRLVTSPLFADFTDVSTGVTSKVWYNVAGNGKNPSKDLIIGAVEIVDLEMLPEIALRNYVGKATVIGTVTYEAGAVKSGSEWVVGNVAYVGKLTAKVVYNAGTDAEITKQFDLVTDKEGKYTLEMPAGDNAVTAEFLTELFVADYTDPSDLTKPVVKKATFVPASFSQAGIVQDKIYTCDYTIAHDPSLDENDENRDYAVKISGVAKTRGERRTDNDVEAVDAYLPFDVVVTVQGTDGRKLAFETKASTSDGSFNISARLYNAWADQNFTVIAETKQVMTSEFKHYYRQYSGSFDYVQFAEDYWWNWSSEQIESMWSFSWKTQNLEGIYPSSSSPTVVAGSKERLYKELVINDIVVNFDPREPKKAMGLWYNSDYNTRNDKDIDGHYTPYSISAQDFAGDSRIYEHDKYVSSDVLGWGWTYGLW